MKLTFDFNCIISLENGEISAIYLKKILSLHNQKKVDVFVPAISGVEKLPNGKYSTSLNDLIKRLGRLSKRPINILDTLMYLDMWFIGHGIFRNQKLIKLDEDIHTILFPDIDYKWKDFLKRNSTDPDLALSKYKNYRCDVISMWCHIFHKTDFFVSNDSNFFKPSKLPRLYKLGANKIIKPEQIITNNLIP